MPEYIDKQAFLDYMRGTSRYFNVKFDIENFPASDVAPVVRCKDCKHEFGGSCILCGFQKRKSEDFCSYGERKETE